MDTEKYDEGNLKLTFFLLGQLNDTIKFQSIRKLHIKSYFYLCILAMNIKVDFEQQIPCVTLSMLNVKSLPESCFQATYQSEGGSFSFSVT